MKTQMEKDMGHDMETGAVKGYRNPRALDHNSMFRNKGVTLSPKK